MFFRELFTLVLRHLFSLEGITFSLNQKPGNVTVFIINWKRRTGYDSNFITSVHYSF